MRFPHRALVITALILGAPAAALVPNDAEPTLTSGPQGAWYVETVSKETIGGPIALALDEQDMPHVVHPDDHNALQYQTYTTLGWSKPQLVREKSIHPSLAFAPNGNLHITYRTIHLPDPAESNNLEHAWLENDTWHREIVDDQDVAGAGSRLVIDQAGHLHVTYGYVAPPHYQEQLRYAFNDGSGWSIETVEEASSAASWSGLAVDNHGVPHFAYCRFVGGNCEAVYGVREPNGTWIKEVVDPYGGSHLRLALDSNDQPHLAYHDLDAANPKRHETLAHATRNASGEWTITTVDADRATGRYTSIALDAYDRPHISYWQVFNRGYTDDPTRGHLKYATLNPLGDWSTEFITAIGMTGDSELRISSTGHPEVAYVYSRDQSPQTPLVPTKRYAELHYAEPVRGILADALLRLTP